MAMFFAQVYELVSCIPAGKVGTYGQIAGMLGDPGRARSVGWAMAGCPEELPWHRMVKSDGSLPNPNFAELQRAMLESEGIVFLHNGRIDMKLYAWNGES